MPLALALSPFLAVGLGALLLMLAEALSTPSTGAPGKRFVGPQGLALGATAVLFAGAACAAALWMAGPAALGDVSSVAPWLILDRFTLFFDMILCLGGGLSALLAGGYLAEHNMERGEFYALILFATF